MPVINLIQEQRLVRQRQEQRARIALLTLAGTVVLGLFGYGILFFEGTALKFEVSRLDSDLTKMKPVIAQIEDNERQRALLSPRLKTLQDAQTQTNRWAHLLQYLRTQTPTDTWLTALQSNALEQDKPTTVVLQGTARAQKPISEFILRTENEPDLENVLLHFTQEKKSGVSTMRAVEFEVGADIAGSAEQKKTVKEDSKS